jgi:hypothetical protein
MLRPATVVALAIVGLSRNAGAQGVSLPEPPARNAPMSRVTVDLASRAFDRLLPFDVPFVIVGVAPEGAVEVAVQYAVVARSGLGAEGKASTPATWRRTASTAAAETFQVLIREPLEARRSYRFRFTVRRAGVAPASGDESSSGQEIVVDGETSRNSHVSADAGLLYANVIETGALYLGTNIYFRPVNPRAPLSERGSLSRRLSITFGFTVTSIADEDNRTRSDLFAHQSLVLGAGIRVTRVIRAGGGVLLFKEADPNPLVTKTSATTTPYISFSFDVDVGSMFARLDW